MFPRNDERWYLVHGRIRRSTWLARVFGVGALMALCVGAIVMITAELEDHFHGIGALGMVPALAMALGFMVFRFIQDIKRLHDIGVSGWFVLFAFVPALNFVYLLFLVFADGQPYTNQFGPDPKGRGSDMDANAVADVFR